MINKFRKKLRNIGIGQRLFFGFIVLPLCVMVFFFLLYYSFSKHMILTKNTETSQQLVSMSTEIFRLNMTKMEEQIDDYCAKGYVYDRLLAPNNEGNVEALERFTESIVSDSTLKNVVLYDKLGTRMYGKENSEIATDAIQQIVNQKTMHNWTYDEQSNHIILTNNIIYHNEIIGYLSFVYKEEAFSATFANTSTKNNILMVCDRQGYYLFGGQSIKTDANFNLTDSRIIYQDKAYYQVSKNIEGFNWTIVNLINADYVLSEIHNFRNMLAVYGLAILIILAILATFVYHSILDPLSNILKSMRHLDEENLANNKVFDEGKDEINELSTNFNDLLNRVQELLDTVQVEQEQKRETQIQLLQAQINPHFLFNTLNTLHYLAILNEDHPVSEGIQALSKLLRNTIADSNDYVTVHEEIENVKNYIIIQKLRFGDLFETVYNIEVDVQHCQILKFLLQPIVENSILHAFEEDGEHQILTIRAKTEGIYLKIEIGDNGKGFERDHIASSNRKLSSIGISNIQERIRLMYGDKYSMKIQSEVGKGTIVTLLLPYMRGGSYVQSINCG